ncbi:hypothetical protein, partial [Cysteiniphilum halobium]|uniref:hypothetical protein n=1 Tax=Cysteiniphilum halobium TaxID=2219059 RepID=UPI003F832785
GYRSYRYCGAEKVECFMNRNSELRLLNKAKMYYANIRNLEKAPAHHYGELIKFDENTHQSIAKIRINM